jgi:signal transduction histidine kinase
MDVVNEEIDFKEREIRSNHKFMEGANEIKLKLEINQKATFISDKKGISVILNNLISNAIKYKDVSKEESFVTVFVDAIVKTQLSL